MRAGVCPSSAKSPVNKSIIILSLHTGNGSLLWKELFVYNAEPDVERESSSTWMDKDAKFVPVKTDNYFILFCFQEIGNITALPKRGARMHCRSETHPQQSLCLAFNRTCRSVESYFHFFFFFLHWQVPLWFLSNSSDCLKRMLNAPVWSYTDKTRMHKYAQLCSAHLICVCQSRNVTYLQVIFW